MTNIISKLRTLHQETDGPTAVEYAVLLALIVGVCLVSIQVLATKTGNSFDASSQAIGSVL